MNKNKATILIIFGISGDLSKRYLLPAISEISERNMLPEQFHIVGLTRQQGISVDSVLEKTTNSAYIREHLSIRTMDVEHIDDYNTLREYLEEVEKGFGVDTEFLFYLSVPPQVSKSIIELIGIAMSTKKDKTKLILEKPFGINLKNAQELATHIDTYFSPTQVYRVDHYMAKETAQNIIVFRDGNSLFKKTWNKDFIERIEIIASEEIGIEGRANFYEQTGALRDFVQNHLLQLLALVLMKLPENGDFETVPLLRLEALQNLAIPTDAQSFYAHVKRGQYEGYTDDVKNPSSVVETFASLTLESKDPRWVGVPLTLTTGKGLHGKYTEIRIVYKKEKDHEANELFLHLQPNEGIEFNIWAKSPGYEHHTSAHHLGFKFKEHYGLLPNAYEQVLFNVINSDHGLFTSSEEVLEAWRIVDTVQTMWEKSSDDLKIYTKGSTLEEIN